MYSYALSLALVEYQTAVLRGDMDAAEEILPTIPKEQRNRVASFLEGKGALYYYLISEECTQCYDRSQGACVGGHDGP